MLLAGLLKPKEGLVRVNNLDPQRDREKLLQKMGFLFQNPEHQLFCDSVYSELVYGLEDVEFVVDEIMQTMGLEKFKNKHPLTLSRSERQRLATATVLVKKSKF